MLILISLYTIFPDFSFTCSLSLSVVFLLSSTQAHSLLFTQHLNVLDVCHFFHTCLCHCIEICCWPFLYYYSCPSSVSSPILSNLTYLFSLFTSSLLFLCYHAFLRFFYQQPASHPYFLLYVFHDSCHQLSCAQTNQTLK